MKYVLIVAGGKGLRMGCELPKQFLPIGGKPVLMRTIIRYINQSDATVKKALDILERGEAFPKAPEATPIIEDKKQCHYRFFAGVIAFGL